MPARGRYRDALRHRDLRLLITSFLIDQIGSWSYLVVIGVYVFDRTHSTQWLAALAVCRWGPGLLLASYGGVMADRYERVTVLIVSSLVSTVLMTGMAVVVAVDAPVGLVLALSALASVALTPYRPASGALIPEVVGERDLAAANSIFSALENLVVVIGPGIGGLLLLTGQPGHRRRDQRGQLRRGGGDNQPAKGPVPRRGGRGQHSGSNGPPGSRRWPRSGWRWPSSCSPPSTPPSTAPAPCSTPRCRSGWAPGPSGYGYLLAGARSAACSAPAWPTG